MTTKELFSAIFTISQALAVSGKPHKHHTHLARDIHSQLEANAIELPSLSLAHCSSSEFVCNNGNCVQAAQECDGRDDCHDNSDEENCSTGEHHIHSSHTHTHHRYQYLCTHTHTHTHTLAASVLAIATVIAVLFLLLFIALPIITCLVVWCCIERRRSNRHTNELDGHSMSSMTIISSAGIHNVRVYIYSTVSYLGTNGAELLVRCPHFRG